MIIRSVVASAIQRQSDLHDGMVPAIQPGPKRFQDGTLGLSVAVQRESKNPPADFRHFPQTVGNF